MDSTIGKEITNLHERKAFISDNCDAVEEMGYMKPFTAEQIVENKERLSEVSIEINEIEQEKEAIMAKFKARLKPLHKDKEAILRNLKARAEYVREDCYKFVYQDERMTAFYNAEGDLIEPPRPARSDELIERMQGRLFPRERTGTND